MRVLAVEDDPEVGETITMAFSMRWPDCQVQIEDTGNGAVDSVAREAFDLVVLDVNLPDVDGFSVLERIRKSSRVPVIMLTVRASEADKVRGLEMGADDYLGKPFSPFELLARASAVLRRTGDGDGHQSRKLQAGSIMLDPDAAEVFVDGDQVNLTPTEFKILSLLVQNAGKVVSRESLIETVWGLEPASADSYLVKLHIQHLRRKLGDSGADPRLIITVRGFGYKVSARGLVGNRPVPLTGSATRSSRPYRTPSLSPSWPPGWLTTSGAAM